MYVFRIVTNYKSSFNASCRILIIGHAWQYYAISKVRGCMRNFAGPGIDYKSEAKYL